MPNGAQTSRGRRWSSPSWSGVVGWRRCLATQLSAEPALPRDNPAGAPGTVASAEHNPTREGRTLQETLHRAIATHRGSCSWTVDHASCTCTWVLTPHSPEAGL